MRSVNNPDEVEGTGALQHAGGAPFFAYPVGHSYSHVPADTASA